MFDVTVSSSSQYNMDHSPFWLVDARSLPYLDTFNIFSILIQYDHFESALLS